MTAILAVRLKGQILIGSDRAWDSEHLKSTCGPKVIALGERYVLGLAGEFSGDWEGLQQENPLTPGAVGRLLGQSSADVLLIDRRRRSILFGTRGSKSWGWGAVRGAAAIGSGGAALWCAWDALNGYELDPKRRMRTALGAVAKRVPGVSAPFDVMIL